ncbi:MAG: phenylalanine--tRNA ligase subunit alpha [Clostridia bacterium]
MQEKINQIVEDCKLLVESAKDDLKQLTDIKVKFLGKNGDLANIMRNMKDVPNEEKPLIGKLVNAARAEVESIIASKFDVLKQNQENAKLAKEKIDVTISGEKTEIGSKHPCTLVVEEILDIFTNLGFEVKSGPEIETDFFNFQALNIPKDHPAREMQDTFYVSEEKLLRTHTSPVQAHVMKSQQPPIRIVVPGKVYRPDDDATHSPMFQQIEGLVVDKGVTLCDLKGALETFAKALFSEDTKIRLRPSYFPFTEPSVEVDVTCAICHGKGCKICKGTGMIEILGAGIVHPNVLKNCGIDPEIYSGFAFGFGIERIAMIKYGIPDMRILFENDIRFLKRFK